jgi:hypothetical protein
MAILRRFAVSAGGPAVSEAQGGRCRIDRGEKVEFGGGTAARCSIL